MPPGLPWLAPTRSPRPSNGNACGSRSPPCRPRLRPGYGGYRLLGHARPPILPPLSLAAVGFLALAPELAMSTMNVFSREPLSVGLIVRESLRIFFAQFVRLFAISAI